MSSLLKVIGIVAGLVMLTACQSQPVVQTFDQSGFFVDKSAYAELKLTTASDGAEVLRRVNPNIKYYDFSRLILDPVVLHPKDQSGDNLATGTLEKIRGYFDKQLRSKLSRNHQIIKANEAQELKVPRMRVAITGVKLEGEGLKVTELLPVGAVIGLARSATGTRSQEVTLFVEVEVIDNFTKDQLFAAVRTGEGDDVRMLWDGELTLDNVKPLIDSWTTLASENMKGL